MITDGIILMVIFLSFVVGGVAVLAVGEQIR